MGFRVSAEDEITGLDLTLHAETAYDHGVLRHGGPTGPGLFPPRDEEHRRRASPRRTTTRCTERTKDRRRPQQVRYYPGVRAPEDPRPTRKHRCPRPQIPRRRRRRPTTHPTRRTGDAARTRRRSAPVTAYAATAARCTPSGLTLALLFFCWSMTPSLLPRVWYLQAVATGISVATGYGIGCLAAWLVRKCGVTVRYSERTRRIGRWTLLGLAVVAVPTFLVLGSWWQQIVRELAEAEPASRSYYFLVLALSLSVAVTLLAIARAIRGGTNRLTAFGLRYVPAPVARLASLVVVLVVGILVVNGVVYQGVIGLANRSASAADQSTAPDVNGADRDAERSGSPASAEPWDSLGREGRTFVAGGPSARADHRRHRPPCAHADPGLRGP